MPGNLVQMTPRGAPYEESSIATPRCPFWQLTSSGEASFWVRASIVAPALQRSAAQPNEPLHAAA